MSKILDQLLYETYKLVHYRRSIDVQDSARGLSNDMTQQHNSLNKELLINTIQEESGENDSDRGRRDTTIDKGGRGRKKTSQQTQVANELDPELFQVLYNKVDFEQILIGVFDLFEVNYHELDRDVDLVLRKLKYTFTEMPPAT